MKTRIISILLALSLVFGLSLVAFADDTAVKNVASEAELTAALADAAVGEIKLTADITVGATLRVAHKVTLDLAGKVLQYKSETGGSVLAVENMGDLTLKDSAPTAEHKFAVAESGLWTLDETNGTKTVKGGVITGGRGTYDKMVYACLGGGVYNNGVFTMQGGSIVGCVAGKTPGRTDHGDSGRGGGVYNVGTFTMEGGAILGCGTEWAEGGGMSYGAGVYTKGGSFTMKNGVISDCVGAANGGGVYTDGSNASISGNAKISDCKALAAGGGIYLKSGSLTLSGSAQITGCSATICGGAVYAMEATTLKLSENAAISGCTAAKGAALVLSNVNNGGVFCTLYADGGKVEGDVFIGKAKILRSADAKGTTVFDGDVKIEAQPKNGIGEPAQSEIHAGEFYGKVEGDYVLIAGGDFVAPVRLDEYQGNSTYISEAIGGTFYSGISGQWNWNPGYFFVSFNLVIGDYGAGYASQLISSGECLTPPLEPVVKGYTFTGWYLLDKPYAFNTPVYENDAAILFGHFTLNDDAIVCPICGRADIVSKLDGQFATQAGEADKGHYQLYRCEDHATFEAGSCLPHVWENGVCKDCEYACQHQYTWMSENGQYWQKCKRCTFETEKKAIPEITITGADRVCRTQDYAFSFVLPEGCTAPSFGYEFPMIGSGEDLTAENGVCSGVVKAEWYDENEHAFVLRAYATTADGFRFSAMKDVTILDEHIGGKATCKDKAICEVCGEAYGELAPLNHTALKHVEGKNATEKREGVKEHWLCEGCGKYYADANAEKEISKADTVLPKKIAEPKTGDTAMPALWIALLVLGGTAAAACVLLGKKRSER